VMSVTWRPPVVWKCLSAWKTFTPTSVTGSLELRRGDTLGLAGP
jgi:hypothetical protein